MGILMVVAILMIIIGGFMYVTSAGSEERAKSGRKTVMYALMGVAVVILAYVLVNIVDKSISTGSPF
jgi:TRAP-type C4-dicarboxylate transport system permease small subunit